MLYVTTMMDMKLKIALSEGDGHCTGGTAKGLGTTVF